ncbi:MAG: hypothetical protein HC887_02155 [Desulfobacteraceae bacterium]|nr:hypothetical protein [Desulfobacteraceae bacterium]
MPVSAYQMLNVLNHYSERLIQGRQPESNITRIRAEEMGDAIIERVSKDLIHTIMTRILNEKADRQKEEKP